MSNLDYPSLIAQLESSPGGDTVDESVLGLSTCLARYLERNVAEALIGTCEERKRQYDASDPNYKTPFAMKDVPEHERPFVLANITNITTSNGCSVGCAFCGEDQFPSRNLSFIPFDQKIHFYDEVIQIFADTFGEGSDLYKKYVSRLILPNANELFDDPDLCELISYFNKRVGVSHLFTAVPKGKEDLFKSLSQIHARYERYTQLVDFMKRIRRGMSEEEVQVWYDEVLYSCGIGELSDYLSPDQRILTRVSNFIREEETYLRANPIVHLHATRLPHNEDFLLSLWRQRIEKEEVRAIIEQSKVSDLADLLMENLFDNPENDQESFECRHYIRQNLQSILGDRFDCELCDALLKLWDEKKGALKQYSFTGILREGHTRFVGKRFYDSGEQVGGFGTTCSNGIKMTPYALLNGVSGRITHQYPRGEVVVPFKGLLPENQLYCSGTPLADFLGNVIVIFNRYGDKSEPPDSFYVFDGNSRIRRIVFDNVNYSVISDEVVEQNADISTITRYTSHYLS